MLFLNQTRQHCRGILLIVLSCLFSSRFLAYYQMSEMKFVVNSSVGSNDICVEQIRSVFSTRQTAWSNNQAITVNVVLKQHQTHQIFTIKILGMFPINLIVFGTN